MSSTISTLEFDDIKLKMIEFLKRDPFYRDFNFEASNINRIINMDAYATTYNGYYMKMVLDESMPDSAKTKTALIAHGNNRNYLTKFITASKSTINVSVDATNVDENVPYILVNRGQQFKGIDKNNKTVYFMSAYDNTLYLDALQNKYVGDDFMLIQGQMRTQTYRVDVTNNAYEINDQFCDETTITVKVKNTKDSINPIEHIRADNFYDRESDGLVYFITASTSGVYKIHFGRDIFGREPKVGEYIEISYVKTDGASANDTNNFVTVLSKGSQTKNTDLNFYPASDITVTTREQSTGGMDDVTVEELRFAVVNHDKIRGRVITPEDIKIVILSEYRDVESINVWSGGTSMYRQYGKTYICIKPKTNDRLTLTGKNLISDLLVNKYGVLSKTDLVFIDPNFTDIILKFKFKVNRALTNDNVTTIKSRIEKNVMQFNTDTLSKFSSNYYDADLVSHVKDNDLAITSAYTEKLLQKTMNFNFASGTYIINFGNTLKDITTNTFQYGNKVCYFQSDIDGNVDILDANDNTKIANGGSLNLKTGKVQLMVPTFARIDTLVITATPVYPDIETLEDNIVRIKKVVAEEVLKLRD